MPAGSASFPTVHLYEDDEDLAGEIVAAFAAEEIAVDRVADEAELRARVSAGQVEILAMDRMVGDRDSLVILEELRGKGHRVPVIVISSLSTVDDRIMGLKAGGDDYLVKPFAMDEFVARVRALARRGANAGETRLSVGPLVLDLVTRKVRRGDREIALLPREFGLLEYLMRHAGDLVTRAMLLEDVWRLHASTQTNVVDVHIGHLRRKVDGEGEPRMIFSARGQGFRITDEAVAPE